MSNNSYASSRVFSQRFVKIVIFPPTMVCSAAPRFPITLRDLTIIPRTTPKFLTIRCPGSSSAVVTMDESTRPGIGFSSRQQPVGVTAAINRCDSTCSRGYCASLARLLFSPCMENLFIFLGGLQVLVGLYLAYEAAKWLAYVRRRAG